MDTEITGLISIFDPNKKKVKAPCFLAVGWDKKLHIWPDVALADEGQADEEEDDFTSCRDLPPVVPPYIHEHDIMSCCFDLQSSLIFTGGVDGALIGWNFETQFPRYELHKYDPTCMSENFIQDCKSVDALVVMTEKHLLLSMTGDQMLRFWDLDDMPSHPPPIYKMHANHMSPSIVSEKPFNNEVTGVR